MEIKVGFEISYAAVQPTPMVIMLSIHPSRFSDIVGTERIVAEPDVPIGFYRDSFGNVCGRLVAPAGGVTLRGDALVRDSGLPDVVMPTAQQLPIDQLPDEVLQYLMPSRYCETDKLTDVAWSLFGNTPPGWARVQAIVDFVHNHVTFGYQHAHHMKSAHDVYEQRAGVCRDFAHLALTFCRCMNIPARYCTGYLGDIGVPRDPAPMDFSGWFQVYLSGQWYTFDARHNVPQGRPHPDGHRPRRRRRRADHELRPDGPGEVFRHQRRGRAGLISDGSSVIPGWCAAPDPESSSFRVRCFASPRNDNRKP